MVKVAPFNQSIVDIIVERLSELLRLPLKEISVHPDWVDADGLGLDALVRARELTFAVTFKSSAELAGIVGAFPRLHQISQRYAEWIPLLVTRAMSPGGRARCREAAISWLDLGGNAHIEAGNLYVHVEGRPNPYKQKGRPSSAFAPKSARIARWLLMYPERFFSQRELARATSMDEGFTSRIVARLEESRLIKRDRQGRIGVANPDLLLDAWAEEYDFGKHDIHRFHVAARSGDLLLNQVASRLGPAAATGLAAAWLLTHYAGFRIVTFYLKPDVSLAAVREHLVLRDDLPGANLWLVYPNDEGVFHGAAAQEGLWCVHPVQAWLDLQGHPERASEAAERLRSELSWRAHAR